MDNKLQQKTLPKFLILFIFIMPIFFAGCNGNSIDENSTLNATETRIILPSSTQTQTITPTITNTITPSPTHTLMPTPTSTPLGNTQGVLLGVILLRPSVEERILFLDINTGNFNQIGEIGFRLQDVSPDGKKILYSISTDLFVMNLDGSGSYLLSNDFDNSSNLGAFWSSNDQIIFIKKLGNKEGVFKVNSDGTDQVKIFEKDGILQLFRTMNDQGVFWVEGYANSGGAYNRGTWWTSYKDGEQINFFTPPFNSIKLSSSGNYLINLVDYEQFEIINTEDIHSTTKIGSHKVVTEYIDQDNMVFSTDESKILLQEVICSPNCDQFSQFIISLNGELISELPEQTGNIGNLFCSGTWSPDDRLFIYGQFIEEGDTFELVLRILDLETNELKTFTNEDFLYTELWRLFILPTTN